MTLNAIDDILRRRGALLASLFLLAFTPGCRNSGTPTLPRHLATAIAVAATDQFLELRLDGRMKDVVDTTTGESLSRYVAVCDLPRHYLGLPGRVLVAGIGSGVLAGNYAKSGWRVTVAEPDERMVELARRRFQLTGNGVTIDARDAREVLTADTAGYDLVLLDLVGFTKAPASLMTQEFFALAATRLADRRGMLALAVESQGWKGEIVELLNTTLKTVFAHSTVLPIAEPPDRFGSIVLVASGVERADLLIDVERNTTFHPDWRYGPEYQKTHAWDNHFVLPAVRLPVQTDCDNRWESVFAELDKRAREQKADYLP